MAIDGASVSVMQAEYFQALAVGDRVRAAGILKRLFDALKDVDPDKIKAGLDLIKKIIGWFTPEPEVAAASADAISMLSNDDLQAAGITTNPALWLTVLHAVMELFKRFRGEVAAQMVAQAAASEPHETKGGHKKHKED